MTARRQPGRPGTVPPGTRSTLLLSGPQNQSSRHVEATTVNDALWRAVPRDPLWETARPMIDMEQYVGQVVIFDLDTWVYSEWYGHKVEFNHLIVFRDGIPSHVGPGWTSAQPLVTQLRAHFYMPPQLVYGRIERDNGHPEERTPRYMLDMLYDDEERMVLDYVEALQ